MKVEGTLSIKTWVENIWSSSTQGKKSLTSNTSLCIYLISLLYYRTYYPFRWFHMQHEENNVLKLQLDELNLKLRRAYATGTSFSCQRRACLVPSVFRKEPTLKHWQDASVKYQLKETEEDSMQLAPASSRQNLVGLLKSEQNHFRLIQEETVKLARVL